MAAPDALAAGIPESKFDPILLAGSHSPRPSPLHHLSVSFTPSLSHPKPSPLPISTRLIPVCARVEISLPSLPPLYSTPPPRGLNMYIFIRFILIRRYLHEVPPSRHSIDGKMCIKSACRYVNVCDEMRIIV